jgi:predicted enzyme related to lactoylglutathione lyase
MIRCWPHITVSDPRASSRWYQRLLGARSMSEPDHPHREKFDALSDADGTTVLCLVSRRESYPETGAPGLELYFVVADFDAAWERARALGAEVVRAPADDAEGYRTRGFTLRDPDGYLVRVGDGAKGWFATLRPGWLQAAR